MVKNSATFIDGPFKGTTLSPNRVPIMLRVAVETGGGTKILGADRELGNGDLVYAYIMDGKPSQGFWDGRDSEGKRVGGQFTKADYRLLRPQPPLSKMSCHPVWEQWCDSNKTLLMADYIVPKGPNAL